MEILPSKRIRQTSPGKNDNLPLVYLPDLLHGVRVVLDFVLNCKLVRPKSALYLVLVHQTEILPPASFRFHVTVDTLAFGYGRRSPAPVRDSHPIDDARAGRTRNICSHPMFGGETIKDPSWDARVYNGM